MKFSFLLIVLAVALFSLPFSAQEQHHHDATEKLQSVSFPTSCASAVQDSFSRGIALLHSFEYEEASHEFQSVAQNDPQCAMAYWGQAMSLYHQLWDQPSKENLQRGADLLATARSLKAPTERERDYIEALLVFFSDPDQLDHNQRASAYATAM